MVRTWDGRMGWCNADGEGECPTYPRRQWREHHYWPGLEKPIVACELRAFRTKLEAMDAGKAFGWNGAIRIHRRFEKVWLCGTLDVQPDTEGDLTFYVVRAPTLRWDTRNGVTRLPVVKFRQLRRADTNEPK